MPVIACAHSSAVVISPEKAGVSGTGPPPGGFSPLLPGKFYRELWNFARRPGNFPGRLGNFQGRLGNFAGGLGNFQGRPGNFPGGLWNFPGGLGKFPGGLWNFAGRLEFMSGQRFLAQYWLASR